MITNESSGVWDLWDAYAKRNAEKWRPDGVSLFSFGANNFGQLAQINRTQYSSPVQIPGTTWSSISGVQHSLATKTDGTLWAWGNNVYGQLGQNNRTYYSSPVQIPSFNCNLAKPSFNF